MGNLMKGLGIKLFLMGSAVALVGFLEVGEADAFSCDSACNQVRRACNHLAKAVKKVDYAFCDDDRDECRGLCELNPASCDCTAICAEICADAPEPETCAAECAAECDCNVCCNLTRVGCRADARGDWQDARLLCTDDRTTCRDTCTGVDSRCVKGCKSDSRACAAPLKRDEVQCKRDCPTGTDRRACVRGCRREMNELLQGCLSLEMVCVGGCITP